MTAEPPPLRDGWINATKRQWWRGHADWPVRTRLWFLYNGFRVELSVEKSIRGAWRAAHILGWVSRRPLTEADIRWAQEFADRKPELFR